MNAADLFVKCLENEGVEYIFGLGGEENLHFLESLRKSSIKFIPVRHEQSAGFMAATYGRLTGKPGVCLSTLGPGATNFVTAAAYAKLGAMPMVMITGQKPINTAPQGAFQKIDIIGMMQPITHFTKQIIHPITIPSLVRKAFTIAEHERPGPVHLELPKDVAAQEIDNIEPMAKPKTRRPIVENKSVEWAIDMIQQAKRPLILVGAGANRKLVSKMLLEFIDKTGIPFLETQMGKGVVDARHNLFLGTAALSANDYLHCATDYADLIINVGHDVIEKPPFIMKQDGAKVIHVNFVPAEVDQVYFPQLELIGDIANAIWQLKEKIQVQDHWDFDYFMKVKTTVLEKTLNKNNSTNFPILPQRIVEDVRKAMPDDGILALDNGMYKLWFARGYRVYNRNGFLVDNALATMGAGLPSAITAKLINPDKKVMCVAGDGGFMMNSQEIETALRLKLDIVILLIRDDGLGMIKWEQEEKGFDNFGLEFGNPDFVKYVESYGGVGHRIDSADDLLPTLQNALDSKGVHLIDCLVDYSENIRVFNEELHQKACPV
jgi:acetolactate synthase I/II/III large subunit